MQANALYVKTSKKQAGVGNLCKNLPDNFVRYRITQANVHKETHFLTSLLRKNENAGYFD
jgi:hypothetical protein